MSLQLPNQNDKLSDFEQLVSIQEILREYAAQNLTPENNEYCAELQELALILVARIKKS